MELLIFLKAIIYSFENHMFSSESNKLSFYLQSKLLTYNFILLLWIKLFSHNTKLPSNQTDNPDEIGGEQVHITLLGWEKV